MKIVKTVHFRIFITFSSLILIIMSVLFAMQYHNFRSAQEKQQSDYMIRFTGAVQESIDTNYQSVFENAMRLCTSSQLKSYFFAPVNDLIAQFVNAKGLRDTTRSILGINNAYPLIEIYRYDNYLFQMDETFQSSWLKENPFASDARLQLALANKGKITVCPAEIYAPTNRVDEKVIPVAMSFSQKLGTVQDNVIILYDSYNSLSSLIKAILPSEANALEQQTEILVILDRNLSIVYPDPAAIDSQVKLNIYSYDFLQLSNELVAADSSSLKKLAINGDSYIYSFSVSNLTGYTTLLLKHAKIYNQSLQAATKGLVIFYILAILAVLFTTYFLSRSLTNPLKKLKNAISDLSLDQSRQSNISLPGSNLYELEMLSNAYMNMTTRLQQSLDDVVSSRSHELQSHMLAMQAQMNPHFLYNILSVISVLSEEQGCFDVVNICSNLSQMLRYVSSESLAPVTIEEEIIHTCIYHELMKNRYGNATRLILDIPDAMMQVNIPKLIIQPLVENSMKYGLDVDPPWIVKIKGWQEADRWHVEVSDNGSGFSKVMLANWKEKTENLNIMHTETPLAAKGVGLLNIYIRMKLNCGDLMIFDLYNSPSGGAVIHLGGIKN